MIQPKVYDKLLPTMITIHTTDTHSIQTKGRSAECRNQL